MRDYLRPLLVLAAVMAGGSSLPALNAVDYGVVADGVTSDDDHLANAVNACAAVGGALYLPNGGILLTGTQSINLKNCHLIGQGVPNSSDGANFGTTFLLTSTRRAPFIVANDWAISHANFYWPNQTTGTDAYPPLFSDDGTHDAGHWALDHVNIVNAYDAFAASGTVSWGAWLISDSWMYAVHDLFRLGVVGDFGVMHHVILDPGMWWRITNYSTASLNAVQAAAATNTILHAIGSTAILNRGGIGGLEWEGIHALAWRYGIKQDDESAINLSYFEIYFDTVGTFADTSAVITAGNSVSPGSIVMGSPYNSGTGLYRASGTDKSNNPAFNLGSMGTLRLRNFNMGSTRASVIVSQGATVYVDTFQGSVGDPGDNGDYYFLNVNGANGNKIEVRNSRIGGPSTIRAHGIKKHVALTDTTITDNAFDHLNDALDVTANDGAPISLVNNLSTNTIGAASVLVSSAGNGIVYRDNRWDKPPKATVGNCGVNPSVTGAFSGYITTGSGAPASCTLTLPWNPQGTSGGACIFTATGGPTGASLSGNNPPTWQISLINPSAQIFFHCPGQQ